jgi:hypothetical protein
MAPAGGSVPVWDEGWRARVRHPGIETRSAADAGQREPAHALSLGEDRPASSCAALPEC